MKTAFVLAAMAFALTLETATVLAVDSRLAGGFGQGVAPVALAALDPRADHWQDGGTNRSQRTCACGLWRQSGQTQTA